VTPKAPAKAPEPKAAAQEAAVAPAADDQMKASFLSDLEKAKQALRIAKGAMTAAASKMFAIYLNLLSPESKYAWNKIVSKQTESDPYINLQGDVLQGPRGISCQLFLDCVMFHLLTAFPINAAEQEKYYITNVLNSLTPKSVPAGAKKILFGRYVLNIYIGILRYFLCKTKTRRAKRYDFDPLLTSSIKRAS
jgi:hypothetical protein